jgi:hypothetical protein
MQHRALLVKAAGALMAAYVRASRTTIFSKFCLASCTKCDAMNPHPPVIKIFLCMLF